MLDVLVTCYPHSNTLALFPQVRGYYLAKHLARSGLRAEFRQLPLSSLACEVLICSEYQPPMDWFERNLAGPLGEIRSGRMFCLTDFSLAGWPHHFSRRYCEWFGARGGVLCHLTDGELLPYEHWIGVGVDADVVRPAPDGRRDHVLFDFPQSSSNDPTSSLDCAVLRAVRERMPGYRLVGSGPPDALTRDTFDDWLDYGQDHAAYVASAFSRAVAVVPGSGESLGLALAEAQVAGACVVSSAWQVKDAILVSEAAVSYSADDPRSLAEALVVASTRDWRRIRDSGRNRFDFGSVVARTRAAIGI